MKNFIELYPNDSRKSFYGKAKVYEKNGAKILRSYETDVIMIDKNGNIKKLWDGYSATTMRHINAFMAYVGLPYSGKKWWNSLPM